MRKPKIHSRNGTSIDYDSIELVYYYSELLYLMYRYIIVLLKNMFAAYLHNSLGILFVFMTLGVLLIFFM